MIEVAKMVNDPENDEYDPNLEEGAEELSYDEESFEDDEFSEDESWDGEGVGRDVDDEAPSKGPTAENKKKGGLFNVILILLALLGGGGFIYLKVLSPGSAKSPVAQTAQAPEQPAPQIAAVPEVEVPSGTTEPAPAVPDIAATEFALTPEPLAAAPALVATGPVSDPTPPPVLGEAPVAPDTVAAESSPAETPVPDQSAVPVRPVEMASAPQMPAPIEPPSGGFGGTLPKADDIMINQNDAALAVTADVADQSLKGIEQKLSVLLARLDTFEGRITSLESGVHHISAEVSTLKAKPAAVADINYVNQAIAGLDAKISAMGQSTTILAKAETANIAEIDKPTFVPAPESGPDVPQIESTPTPNAVVSAVDTPKKLESAPVSTVRSGAVTERTTSWVLRSAQPGTAMVSPNTGGDMRSVKVGDTLSGVGRIVAIEKNGGQWVVRGTSGTIVR